jgi:predicted transcriptional regulator
MRPELSTEIQELAERQASLCRIFGNPQRLVIVWLLAERERTVTEIALAIGASLQSTSQHLRILEFRHLVESRRQHHNIYYHITNNELLEGCMIMVNRPKNILKEVRLV